jgi:hypothetical protein
MSQDLIVAAAAYLGARATGFLDEILKPTGEAIGQDLLKRYESWRAKNLGEVFSEYAKLKEQSGVAVQPPPGRILFSLIEYASLEEDEGLRRKWAALLLNAAADGSINSVLPGYVEILRQLTPVQAAMLDWVYETKSHLEKNVMKWKSFSRTELEKHFHLTSYQSLLLVTDLTRLQVMEASTFVETTLIKANPPREDGAAGGFTAPSSYSMLHLTQLGIGLVEICKAPPPKAKS